MLEIAAWSGEDVLVRCLTTTNTYKITLILLNSLSYLHVEPSHLESLGSI